MSCWLVNANPARRTGRSSNQLAWTHGPFTSVEVSFANRILRTPLVEPGWPFGPKAQRAESAGFGPGRGYHHCAVAHREAAARRVDRGPDARQQLLELRGRQLAMTATRRELVQPLVACVGPLPLESPLFGIVERA